MTRVITTPPPPKKVPATPPPQAKIFFPKRPNPKAKPTHRPITFIPTIASTPPQSRNVSQPVKKPTDWCGCEFWDIGCKAGCFSQEQIVDPVVSGTQWLGGGVDVHVTQPITEAWTETELAYKETEKFFGDTTASAQVVIDDFVKNTEDAWESTMQWGADVQTNLSTIGGDIQKTLAGGTQWLQEQAGTAGNMFTDMSALPRNLGAMMGNMMRGMGNIANVGSSSFGWIKWVLIAVGALIAGFIAWRVLK